MGRRLRGCIPADEPGREGIDGDGDRHIGIGSSVEGGGIVAALEGGERAERGE